MGSSRVISQIPGSVPLTLIHALGSWATVPSPTLLPQPNLSSLSTEFRHPHSMQTRLNATFFLLLGLGINPTAFLLFPQNVPCTSS